MVKKRGGMIYAPKIVIDELDSIRGEEQIDSSAEALKKMVKYTRVGREARRIASFNFGTAPRQQPVDNYFIINKKRKK